MFQSLEIMIIQTLENCSLEDIVEVFNTAFSDYIISISLTQEQLANKILSDGIRLPYSVGVFEECKLVGFILHALKEVEGRKIAYNAGTGIIPSKRRNGLSIDMYNFIFPILIKQQVKEIHLEVITTNERALNLYKKIGFEISREVVCVKGSIQVKQVINEYKIAIVENYDWHLFQTFWDITPTWQNAISAIENTKSTQLLIGAFDEANLIGYLVYNKLSKRIHQIAIHPNYRQKGIGHQLVSFIKWHHSPEINILNIDLNSKESNKFCASISLTKFISQYEMKLNLGA